MKVADVLQSKGSHVVTVTPDASVTVALSKLKTGGIGALVVSADGARIDGILSERDVVRGLAERGARVAYTDPWVPSAPPEIAAHLAAPGPVELDPASVASFDLLLIATDHTAFDWDLVAAHARLVIDTRHALASRMQGDPRWVPA